MSNKKYKSLKMRKLINHLGSKFLHTARDFYLAKKSDLDWGKIKPTRNKNRN